MKLRTASIISALLIILVAVSGCGGKKPEAQYPAVPESGTIETADSFLNSYQGWTSRLEKLGGQTQQAYMDWESNKIDTETYIVKSRDIYEAIKKLNDEADLKADIKLSDGDKQKVKHDEVTSAYNKASKGLNDYLYQLPHIPDDQIKVKYKAMIEKYNSDMTQLKKSLNM
ncbi:MAG: hypothetical protein HPY50_07910 [Firmicutes bacterium]|nr:hypothetical protein [Bacillota bacterium]